MKRQYTAGFLGMIILTVVSFCLTACTDDTADTIRNGTVATEATPVRFEVTRTPLYSVTPSRAVPEPRQWHEGDRIQIRATFTGKEMSPAEEPQYGCYRYVADSDDWVPDADGDAIIWPVGAEKADFEAYYIEGLTGRISEDPGTSATFLLGDITEGGDPLYADKKELTYGRSVPLDFKHLCTHLEMTDVKSDLSGGYWLYIDGENELANAYSLSYSKEKGLTFAFTTSDECLTDGDARHYYIARQRNAEGTVDFYLARNNEGETLMDKNLTDKYGNCKLTYRFNRSYLSIKDVDALNNLAAGTHYELSTEKELGIVPEPQTEFPNEPETNLGEVDIPELLAGIQNGTDVYDSNDNIVLKATGEPYPRLMRDVDFKNFNPLDHAEKNKEWKLPTLDRTFDGNFHSFLNVAYPVFGNIETNGKIYNLAIRKSECIITVENIQKMEEFSIIPVQGVNIVTDLGLLTCIMNGNFSNILLENVDMTVHITEALSHETQLRTYRIGCIAGNQNSDNSAVATKIEKVELRGNVKLTVTTDDSKLNTQQECYAGIVAGQSGAVVDGVSMREDGKCTVSINVLSDSEVFVGGILGRSVNKIRNIQFNGEVDGSGVDSQRAFVGGLCGKMVNEKAEFGLMKDCTANVTVRGGTIHLPNAQVYAHAYTGGIAGSVDGVIMDDVFVTGSVTGGTETVAKTENTQMINYATGGGFGYVSGEHTDIKNCNVRMTVTAATVLTGSPWGNDTGNFAGLSTQAAEELQAQAKNNTARENADLMFVGKNASEPGS